MGMYEVPLSISLLCGIMFLLRAWNANIRGQGSDNALFALKMC